jgi:hypothetical protein
MFFPPVLDPISREFLWSQNDWYCKNTFWAWTGQGITKLICCKFLCQERMKLIMDQINPCNLVLKKTLQNYVEIKCQLDATDNFYSRSYCLLNTFWTPLCPSSVAREYYRGGCCLWYLVLWFSSCRVWCGAEGYVSSPQTTNLKTKAPNTTGSNHLCNTLEFLMMGIVVPETCWAGNKICNKNHLWHLVGILFPHINDECTVKTTSNLTEGLEEPWFEPNYLEKGETHC